MINKLITSDYGYGGIYRALLIDDNTDLRIIVPGLYSNIPVISNDDGSYVFDMTGYEQRKYSYPIPMWNVPNKEAQEHEKPIHPCWVTFENGNVHRPIIMGWQGKGIRYHAQTSGSNTPESDTYNIDNDVNQYYAGNYTSNSNNGDYIFNQLIKKGLSIGGACAVLGNLSVESSFNPIADNGSHRGIAQWDKNDRWNKLINWCNKNNYNGKYDTIEAQTAYLSYDLETEKTWLSQTKKMGYKKLCENITTEQQVKDLAKLVQDYYERAVGQNTNKRQSEAVRFWNIFKNGNINPA